MSDKENYEKLIEFYKSNKDNYSLDYFYNLGKQLPFIERAVFDYHINYQNFFYNDSFILSIYEQEFIDKLINNKETNYLINNLKIILRKKLDRDTESLHEEVLEFFKSNIKSLSKKDLYIIFFEITRFISLHNNSDYNVLKLEKKILEVTNSDNISLLDIKMYKEGGYSKIFKLNDYIIKVGNNRACDNIADNSRILLPIFKGYVKDVYLEITDYCNTKDVSLDELYNIYEELRNEGVLWFDPCSRNIGVIDDKLIKKQIERRKNIKDLGIIENPNKDNKILKNNDYVIIDLDHMVFDNDLESIERLKNRLNEDMEQRLDYFERRYNDTKKKILK